MRGVCLLGQVSLAKCWRLVNEACFANGYFAGGACFVMGVDSAGEVYFVLYLVLCLMLCLA